MKYIQNTVMPPNKISNFSLHDYTGGLNNRAEIVAENEAVDLINMEFSNDTLMEKRKGFDFFEDYSAGAPFSYLGEFRPYTDPDELMMATNSTLYSFHVKVADLGGRMFASNVSGRFFFVDGASLRVYGRFPQTGGTYVKIQGTPTDVRHVFTVTNPPEGFTPLDKTHVVGVTVYDYESKKCWYEPCQHEMEDTTKGANVIPEKPKYIVQNDGRVFLSGSERDNDNVFISDTRNPFYFPVYLPIQLPPNSDEVRGLIVYDDSIVVGREHDIYVIHGKTNRTDAGVEVFNLRKLNSHTGIASQASMTVAHNFLFFLGSDGVAYALASTNYDQKTLATQIISRQLDLFKSPLDFEVEELSEATAIFHNDTWYLSINDKTLVYNYRIRAWTLFENMNASSFHSYNRKLIWGDALGRISTIGKNYLDYGHPFRCMWKSKRFDMGDSSISKQFREFQVVAFTFDDVRSDIDVMFEVDYVDVAKDVFTDSMIAVFGRAKWGDRFISRNINESLPMLVGVRGRLISFRLSNGYRPEAPVQTMEDLTYYVNRKHNILVFVESEDAYFQYDADDRKWHRKETSSFNQSMKVYQVNGEFEFRHRR